MIRRLLVAVLAAGALAAGFAATASATPTSHAAKKPFLDMQIQLSGLGVDYPGHEELDINVDNTVHVAVD